MPKFDPRNPVHQRLSALSMRAHELAGELSTDACGKSDPRTELQRALVEVESQADEAAAELWGVTPQELKEVQRNLQEMRA